MGKGFFDPENGLFSTLSLLVDIVGLSILWVFLSLPILTLGASTAALYYTVVKRFREGEMATFTLFFQALRRELRQGIVCILPFVGAALLLFPLHSLCALAAQQTGWTGSFAAAYFRLMLLLPLALFVWLFPLLGRFTWRTRSLYANALRLSLTHLPSTLLLLAETVLVWGCILRCLPLLFVLPSLWLLLLSFPLERAFRQHTEQ